MRSVKSVLAIIAFLLIATGFGLLIWFEITYGLAGGKFGGAQLRENPGTFAFIVAIQAFYGLSMLSSAIKELRKLTHRKIDNTVQPGPAGIIATYWVAAAVLLLIVNLLAVWSVIEMVVHANKILADFEMPKKAIFGGLFLLCIAILCYLLYEFEFRSLIDTVIPKARSSIRLLRKKRTK